MQPEEFSTVAMYGNREIFERKLAEDYTEVAFGGGPWIDDFRIVAIWIFYHPSGKVATYQHPKTMYNLTTFRPTPFEAEYDIGELGAYLTKHQITLGARGSLAELMNLWEK